MKRNILTRLPGLASLRVYWNVLCIVFKGSRQAKHGRYDVHDWSRSSLETKLALERAGVEFEITGREHFRDLEGPCVFIGNHMSTLETFVLPCLIAEYKDTTFVVKQSLVDYPVFRYMMRSRDPITVGRENPRDDLRAVLDGGTDRLQRGMSIVVFPQTTRSEVFNPAEFNSIGVKLAKKAGVPVVPIALKTDAWANGRFLRDFGRIDPSKKVHIAFGEPLRITGRGDEEHRKIVEFIVTNLKEWGAAL
ncbi:MAG: glycerol acyltransferase [Nitrospirae bacterium GWC2_57_13]|jgi:1-acyl-sn-glycerol-3-phosphate acyltransferase|nr:MAG: glycerol acyltransferase [Nitrospirae bacterium GWC2_57_13]HAR46374.1 1-acyl-sn-glycerol-3-phosphate acyltransferase [Nitrospiraceae bacterium]HAS54697.1 1-acyl-sn-glycerol-3-phosphate acyltransferase [Nitrospiraceae bacterium]